MKQLILFVCLFLCSMGVFSQTSPPIELLLELGQFRSQLSLHEKAHEALWDAAQLARQDHKYHLEAQSLYHLAQVHSKWKSTKAQKSVVAPFLDLARALSVRSGDLILERRILSSYPDLISDSTRIKAALSKAVDCSLALHDYDGVEDATEKADGSRHGTMFDAAAEILDQIAMSQLAEKRGDISEGHSLLNKAVDLAQKQNWIRAEAKLWTLKGNMEATGDISKASSYYRKALGIHNKRGDLKGQAQAQFAMGKAYVAVGDKTRAYPLIKGAMVAAQQAKAQKLLAQIQEAMGDLVTDHESERWKKQADRTRKFWRQHLLARAEKARLDPKDNHQELINELENIREIGTPFGDKVSEYLRTFGRLQGIPRSQTQKDKYVAAFKRLIARKEYRATASMMSDVAHRPEVVPAIVEMLSDGKDNDHAKFAMETLPTQEHLPLMFNLLDYQRAEVQESGAVSIMRLAGTNDIKKIKQAISNASSARKTIYLHGALAKLGDKSALEKLRQQAQNGTISEKTFSNAILGQLGFASPLKRLWQMRYEPKAKWKMTRLMARAPKNWGTRLLYDSARNQPLIGARALALKGDTSRYKGLGSAKNIAEILWRFPRNQKEARTCGTNTLYGLKRGQEAGGTIADIISWGATRSGVANDEAAKRMKKPQSPVAELGAEELETTRHGALEGAQTITMSDTDASGVSMCRITAWPKEGILKNGSLSVPFQWKHDIDALAGGINGRMYKDVILKIQETTLLSGGEFVIPGVGKVPAKVRYSSEKQFELVANLPLLELSEGGLDSGKPIPLETLAKSKVVLRFNFMDTNEEMVFPIKFMTTNKKKPDLEAVEVIVDPPVPEVEHAATITLKVKNTGKTVKERTICTARFRVFNPTSGQGWRTLDARVFNAEGWRTGEIREFVVRPKFVEDYYMNKYSSSWTAKQGDTRVEAIVDAGKNLDEEIEDNNTALVEIPIELPKEKAKQYAAEEIIRLLKEKQKQIASGNEDIDVHVARNQALAIVNNAKVNTPEIEVVKKHLLAAAAARLFEVRMQEAARDVIKASKNNTLDKVTLNKVLNRVSQAQEALLESGVPAKKDTIIYVRNRTMATTSLLGSKGDHHDLYNSYNRGQRGYDLDLEEQESALSGEAGNVVAKMDGIMLLVKYVRDTNLNKDGDPADVLEAASNLIPSDMNAPFLSNMHRSLLSAEMKYVEQGFRKTTTVLQRLNDVMDGKEGADEALILAAKAAEAHAKKGPLDKKAAQEFAKGVVKDLPLIGPLFDMYWSWGDETAR